MSTTFSDKGTCGIPLELFYKNFNTIFERINIYTKVFKVPPGEISAGNPAETK